MMNQNPSQLPAGLEKEVHLADYLNVVLRRWKIASLVFLMVFSGVAIKTFMTQPVYEAFATIEVRRPQQAGMLKELGMQNDSTLSTEIEVLQSRSLAENVARRMNLGWQIGEISDGLKLSVGQLAVSETLPGLVVSLVNAQEFTIADLTGGVLGVGRSGELFNDNGVTLQVEIDKGAAGQRFVIERQPLEPIVGQIIDNLRVTELGKGSNILRISSQSTDPGRARDIVNLLAESYRTMNVASKTQEAGKTVDFISDQLGGLKDVLDVAEQNLQEYKVETGLATLGPEGSSLVEKLVSLEQNHKELQLKRQRVELAISELRDAIQRDASYTPSITVDLPQIASLGSQLAQLEAEKKSLLVDYTEAHPQVVQVQAQIRRLQGTMLSSYQSVRQELLLGERDMSQMITGFDAQLDNIPQVELELAKRTRVHKVNAELYTFLLQKQQEARIAQASTISNVNIVDPASTPKFPIKPNKKKNLALGLILGLMLGVGLTFLLDYMDQTIKTSEDVRDKLGLNVFGIIPRIPFADEDAKLPSKRLVTTLEPKAPVVEAFRALRTNLNYITAREKHQIIMVTSSLPSEGKSTISGNLAVVLAQTGVKVLLVGCDLRRPSLYDMFEQKNVPGLVDLLTDENQGALRHLTGLRLDFISAGTIPPNPAEILDSGRMNRFLEMARERYDYVILDAPPVLPVTDAQILAPKCDINLIVLEPCRVPERAALQMVESMRAVDAKIAGVILNDKSGRGFKYYGNYQYYGNKYYRGYYGESHDKPDGAVVGSLKKVWEKLNS